MLTLEGAQAGLSWSTILRKRAGYRRAFARFEPRKVARFDARRRAALRRDAGIVRNRLKIESTVSNARAFLAVQREFGSFDRYLWSYVAGKPIVNRPRGGAVPARTPLSDQVSRDLVKPGFRFLGTTISSRSRSWTCSMSRPRNPTPRSISCRTLPTVSTSK